MTPRFVVEEEVEFLASCGCGTSTIATRLGMTPAAIARALHRAGRHDLAGPWDSIAYSDRDHHTKTCIDCAEPVTRWSRGRCWACSVHERSVRAQVSA